MTYFFHVLKDIYLYKAQISVNDILSVLIDNLFKSLSDLHNFSFIEVPVLMGEHRKDADLQNYVNWKSYHTRNSEESETNGSVKAKCQTSILGVTTHPILTPIFLSSDQTCVWSRVAVVENSYLTSLMMRYPV